MIRPLTWLWHRAHGNGWMARAAREAVIARDAVRANRISAERARWHFARADELYPPPPRGPPDNPPQADGDHAPAHQDGPEIR